MTHVCAPAMIKNSDICATKMFLLSFFAMNFLSDFAIQILLKKNCMAQKLVPGNLWKVPKVQKLQVCWIRIVVMLKSLVASEGTRQSRKKFRKKFQ